jgi:hypothetical protein
MKVAPEEVMAATLPGPSDTVRKVGVAIRDQRRRD